MRRALTELEREWSLRAMLDAEVAPPALCKRAVREAVILSTSPTLLKLHSPRTLIAHVSLRQRAIGITLGRHIYITSRLFDADGELPLSLVIHEVTHVAQYLRDGYPGFLTRYVKDYISNLARGMNDREAYLAIPHEVEARRTEAYLQSHMHDAQLRQVRRIY